MSNFFLKNQEIRINLWKSFLLCGTSSSFSLHLGRIIWEMLLSQSRVSKTPMEYMIDKPSHTHLHCSVKRVMFFNGIFLSCTGVTRCANFPELENRQRMAGNVLEDRLEEWLCRDCTLPSSWYFPSGRYSWLVIWITGSPIKKSIGKIHVFFFFFFYGNTYRPQSTLWPFALGIVHLNLVYAVKVKKTRDGPVSWLQLG